MCGRFTLRTPPHRLAEAFGVAAVPNLPARYNVAPTQDIAVVRRRRDEAARELVLVRWGLIPHWADDAAIGNRMINARAETVASKPAFRTAFRERRCLVAADGFYEWQKTAEGGKQPWFIAFDDDSPFAFAGLWARWRAPEGEEIESCTLITTAASAELAPIHPRMPVIVPPEAYDAWLGLAAAAPDDLARLLRADGGAALRARPVGRYVNDVRNDAPACIAPAA